MRATSELYQQILRDDTHHKRHRAFVAGVEYGPEYILTEVEAPTLSITQPPLVTSALFSGNTPSVGNCVAKQLDILLLLQETPPPMADIRLETQLVLTDPLTGAITAESEWVPQGTYYIDTRRPIDLKDEAASLGALLIHGYDAMLKLEQAYIPDDADLTDIPQTMPDVAADIAAKIGVSLDTRTQLQAYHVDPPLGYTMREVMGWIAAAHAGNWTMTGAGDLRLVPLNGIPTETGYLVTEDGDAILLGGIRIVVGNSSGTTGATNGEKTFVGSDSRALEAGESFLPYTGVILWYDDESAYRAGDDSGLVLEVECIWGTQAMANAILSAVSGYAYRPYKGTGAVLDPAAELGDGVTINNVYSLLASITTTYDALTASDIAAPGKMELDSEYSYEPPEKRELRRKITLGKSYYGTRITRQNGLEVVKTAADGSESARVRLNSDVLAFYDADGSEALYFDAEAGKYRFCGDVAITGGTMNVNDNFIVDADGNLTLKGKINFTGGSITWGDNDPTEEYLRSIGITEITSDDVKSPRIEGGQVYGAEIFGGRFLEDDGESYIKLEAETRDNGASVAFLSHYVDMYSANTPVMQVGYVYYAEVGYIWVLYVFGYPLIMVNPLTGAVTYNQSIPV